MKNYLIATAVAAFACAGAASAAPSKGGFQIWEDNSTANVKTVVVSYAGDGAVQEAQADIVYTSDWKVVASSTKVAGSVCAAIAGTNILRAVPPSGAGSALSAKSVDYCSFQLKRTGAGVRNSGISVKFAECWSPAGTSKCAASQTDIK